MVSFNRETMMMVAVVIALAATFYMYKELQKTKQDVQSFSSGMTTQLQTLSHALTNDAKKKEVVAQPEQKDEE